MIEICFGAIATITAVYMTHLQSGWMYGASLPHYLMRCVGNQMLFEPNSPFNDSVLIHQKYDHTLTEKDDDDVIKKVYLRNSFVQVIIIIYLVCNY
jgi:hypothetical protein